MEIMLREILGNGGIPSEHLLFYGRGLRAWGLALGRNEAGSPAGRATWVFAGPSERVKEGLAAALDTLREAAGDVEEPPLNVICFVHRGLCVAVAFPRAAHRPSFFFAEEPERLLVSPGAVDVAGLAITVREEDFVRMDADVLREIYRQTCLGPAQLARHAAKLIWRLEGSP